MPKSSFVLYLDYKKHFDLIQDDTDFRRLIEAIFAYCETGTEPSDLSPVALMAFSFIRAEINKEKSGRELDVTASEWQALRKAVFERDGYRCQYRGKIVESPQCDHVFPFSRGGRSTMDNLVTACPRCNMSKHAKTPEEWRQFKANSMRKWGGE